MSASAGSPTSRPEPGPAAGPGHGADGGFLSWVQANEEKFRLVGYLAVMVGLGVPLADLISRGYGTAAPGSVTRFVVRALAQLTSGLATLQAFVLGGLLALVTILTLDDKKWLQGVLLWIGLFTLGIGFWAADFMPRVFLRLVPHLGQVALGALAATALVVPRSVAKSVLQFERPATMEFRRAPQLVFAGVMVAVAATYVEYHLIYPPILSATAVRQGAVGINTEHLFVDTVTAAGFVATTYQFMQYEAETTVAVLGKQNAGKSMFSFGAISEYIRRTAQFAEVPPIDPSEDLCELIARSDEATVNRTGQGRTVGEWFVPNNPGGDRKHYEFTIRDGTVFPTNLRIGILDYAGERLPRFVERFTGAPSSEQEDGNPEVMQALEKQVDEADVVVLLIDIAALLDPDRDLGARMYADLIPELRDQKRIVFAATKADHFEEDFREQTGRDPYDVAQIDRFARFVTDEVTHRSTVVRRLMNDAGADLLHPVYLRTTENEEGKGVPLVNDEGEIEPFGYIRLLEELK